MTRTEERKRYDAAGRAGGWVCACDGSEGRAACALPHLTGPTGPRCKWGGFVLITEPNGRDALICNDCVKGRLAAKFTQTNLFDLIEGETQ
jgi:hypothetical protein